MFKKLVFTIILFFLLFNCVFAQSVKWNTAGMPVTNTDGIQRNPCIVSDGSGGALAFYEDARGWDIRGVRIGADGSKPWPAGGIEIDGSANTNGFGSPQAISDGSGGALIVWEFWNNKTDIAVQHIDSDGNLLWNDGNPVKIYQGGSYDRYPAVVSDGAYGMIVAWMHEENNNPDNMTTNDWSVMACRVNLNGSIVWGPMAVTAGQNSRIRPQLCTDTKNGVFITWMLYAAGAEYDIYCARVNPVGSLVFADKPICAVSGNQFFPRIAEDGNAGAVIVWHDFRNTDADIYAQRVTDAGSMLWQAGGIAVSDLSSSNEMYPCIARLASGGFVVAWEDRRNGNYDIYAQKLDISGNRKWDVNGISVCSDAGTQNRPVICASPDDSSYIIWQDYSNGVADIYCRLVDATGVLLWDGNAAQIAASTGVNESYNMAIDPYIAGIAVVDSADNLFSVWESGFLGQDIYCQKTNQQGVKIWGADAGIPVAASRNTEQKTEQAFVISDNAGGAVVAWADDGSGNWDIYARHLGPSGADLWSAGGIAVCSQKNKQSYPRIAYDGAGGYIFTWQDERTGLYAQKADSSGRLVWTGGSAGFGGIAYCTAVGGCERPEITGDGSGGGFLVWMDNRSGNWDIYAQHLGSDGNVLWQENGVPVCTVSGVQQYPQILSDMSGGIIVIWEDSRNGNFDIYAQRLKPDGTAQWQENGTAVCSGQSNQRGPDADGIYGPKAVSDGAGGAIAVWQDDRNGWEIYAQRIGSDGVLLWDMMPTDTVADGMAVCTAINTQDFASVCVDNTGGALIVWRDFRNDTGYSDIYAQHVGSDGLPMWIANGIAVSVDAKGQHCPAIVSDGSGGAIIAWQDYSNGTDWDIYCARMNTDGTFAEPGWPGYNLIAGTEDSMFPLLCQAGIGSAVTLWQDNRIESKFDIFGTKVSSVVVSTTVSMSVSAGAYMPAGGLNVSADDSSLEMFQVNISNTGTEEIFVKSITFTTGGSGNDVEDIDYVRLYEDGNNDGQYASSDVFLSGDKVIADDGTVTLAVMRAIAVSENAGYIVVYDLSGKAVSGADFFIGIDSSAGIDAYGADSSGPVVISMPDLLQGNAMAIASASMQMSLGENNPGITFGISADGTALEMLQIKVHNAGAVDGTISSITFSSAGTANEIADVAQAVLVLDANANGICDDPSYVLSQQTQNFSEDNGRITFDINRTIAQASYEYWILAYYINNTVSGGETFYASVAGTPDVTAGAAIKGLPLLGNKMTVGLPPANSFVLGSAVANSAGKSAFNNAQDVPVLSFFLRSDLDHALEVSSIKITASGTANDLTDVSGIRLYADTNGDGLRDEGDVMLGKADGFSGDDGIVVFSGVPLRTIPEFSSEQWLTVCDFAGAAESGKIFSVGIISGQDIVLSQSHPIEFTSAQGGAITFLEGGKLMSVGDFAPAHTVLGIYAGVSDAVQYQWDFDYAEQSGFTPDWTGILPEEITHEYFIPGIHIARLTVNYADGTSVCDDVEITIVPDPDAPDVSAWAEVPLSGVVPLNIDFKATAVSMTGYICMYAWDFDGDGIIDWSNVSTGDVAWTYGQAGSYKARFIAADNYGRMNAQELAVSVGLSSAGNAPQIDAVFAVPSAITAGETVYFGAACNPGLSGYIAKYEWDFDGDGNYDWSSLMSPYASYVYNKEGTYTVRLRVTDSGHISVVRSAEVFAGSVSSLSVWMTHPESNSSVSGDNVTIRAVAGPEQVAQSVIFQYAIYGAGDWKNIGYFITPPPYEFLTSWNTLGLAEGQYELRAVAADANSNNALSTSNGSTIVAVSASNPDIFEGNDSITGEYYTEVKTYGSRALSANLNDGTEVYMPGEASTGTDTVLVKKLKQNPTLQNIGFLSGSFREIGFASNSALQKPVQIVIPYSDTNNDGYIDGTAVSEEALNMYHFNTDTQTWEVLPGLEIDTTLNKARAITGSLSYFSLAGPADSGGSGGTGGTGGIAPMFAGADFAEAGNETTVTVSWEPASDDHTPPSGIVYLIYMADAQGGEDFLTPSYVTLQGVSSYQITGLEPGTDYYFVVRARDENGNIDANTIEAHAKTAAVPAGAVEDPGKKSGKGCFVKQLYSD
ncbi:MAG: PKD domain-containing protein [Planctomycetes bacterium]|nr:PKD domain-containing protein [Planctomycetota bacterium]